MTARPNFHPDHWPKAGASIAVFKDGHVLLSQRAKEPAKGIWSLPGGHIEPGETASDAALRELMEETGITAELIGINRVVDVILHEEDAGDLRAHYVISSFVGIWLTGEPVAGSDAADARWFDLRELTSFGLTQQTFETIRSAQRKHKAHLDLTPR